MLHTSVTHDRRRQKVVEELLDAMRMRARAMRATPQPGSPTGSHAPIRRNFWRLMAALATTLFVVALVARWAKYYCDLRDLPLGAGGMYGWLSPHRACPTFPG